MDINFANTRPDQRDGDQRHDGEKHDRLAARGNDDPSRIYVQTPPALQVAAYGLTQLRQPRARAVVGKTFLERLLSSGDNVARRIEIRFANLQVDDRPAPGLEGPRADQHLKSGFLANVVHPLGRQDRHRGEGNSYPARGVRCGAKTWDGLDLLFPVKPIGRLLSRRDG